MLAGFGRVELAGVLRMSVQDMQLSDCTCLSDNAFFFAVDDVGPTSKQDPATWRRTLFPADYGSRCADTLSPQPSTLNPQPSTLNPQPPHEFTQNTCGKGMDSNGPAL